MKKAGYLILLIIILSLCFVSYVGFVSGFNFNIFNNNKNILQVTDEHPFLVDGNWTVAKNLNVGDELFLIDGRKARIVSIKDVNESADVYNLEAGKYSDFVLFNGVVVHNSNKPINVPEISDSTRAKFAGHEQRPLKEVYDMSDEERLAYAESRIGEFSPNEREAILYAHHNFDTVSSKSRYLKENGIDEIERDILLSEGVCGTDTSYGILEGDFVKFKRSSGDEWEGRVMDVSNGRARVFFEDSDGLLKQKSIPIDQVSLSARVEASLSGEKLIVDQSTSKELFDVGRAIPDDDVFVSRSFIDKEDYFNARFRGMTPQGDRLEQYAINPGLAYGETSWWQWKQARDYMERVAKTSDGQISQEFIRELGARMPEQTIHASFARVPAEDVTFRGVDVYPGPDYYMGYLGVYDESHFLSYSQNPYLRANMEYMAPLSDSPRILQDLMDRYPNKANYFMANAGNIYFGPLISYPSHQDVPRLLDELLTTYNPRIASARTVEDIVSVAADFQREFVSIHPFNDGNGRTSRLLMDYILRSKGLPPSHLGNPNLDLFLSKSEWRKEVLKGVINAAENAKSGVVY